MLFLRAAMTDVTNSGNDVPIAITVTEIRKSLSQSCFAISVAPFTVSVPPK